MTQAIQFNAIQTDAPARSPATGARPRIVRDLLVRTAAFVVLAAASTTLMAVPYLYAGDDAAAGQAGYSARLEQAFQAADAITVRQELTDRLSAAAKKTDRLAASSDCGAQTWPHIEPRCATNGVASAPSVRTVTVEYRLGERSSALVRLPVQQIAAQ